MRYYGNKTKLLNFISDAASELEISKDCIFFDAFSGTTSVAKHFKSLGYTVIANDWLHFSYILASVNIELNQEPNFAGLKKLINTHEASEIIDYLNKLDPISDFITKNYTPFKDNHRQYFTVENGSKIDSIRIQIQEWFDTGLINTKESHYLIASLIYAINLVSNVSGTYGSFLKKMDRRALKPITLKPPQIISSTKKNIALNENVLDIVEKHNVDIIYLDPPYNSRQYASNYFLLELISDGWFGSELPKIYGHTGMRPYNHQKSSFSMKNNAKNSLEELISKVKTKFILLSYNNEGIISQKDVIKILSSRGDVKIITFDHKRYRSVGQNGDHNKTEEHLFIVDTREK
jgi:adenine-specific DNA methylase